MPKRISSIWLSTIVLPLIAFGQLQNPVAVAADQALRARVSEFLQYHVDGNFRKAYDLIADDTKDDYFNSGKVQLLGFSIDKTALADNYTKATVTAMLSKTINIVGQELQVTVPSITTWKIENGKWVWYNEVKTSGGTPMDPITTRSAASAAAPNPAQDNDLPKNLDQKAIAAAAQSILQQVGVDKKEVTLAINQPSEARVVFHNGMPGSVQLELSGPEIPGFTAKIEQSTVRAYADVPVVFRYEPPAPAGHRDSFTIQLVAQPLNQTFAVVVNFAAPVAAPK